MSPASSAPLSPARLLGAVLVLTLVFRFWLAATLPITGDEAYFIAWGKQPDWGFYDHPPLIGWWLAALLTVSDAGWWLRLPQILQPALLAWATRLAWPHLFPVGPRSLPGGTALPSAAPDDNQGTRDWVALLVLLAPANVWNVLVTTDTALVYGTVLSGLAWLRATRDNAWRWYVLAGVFLAGAVLSKYFAALLGFAYLVDAVRRRSAPALAGLVITYACVVPALLLMAWWNSEHCWANYMFNFVNRHGRGNTGLSAVTPLLYGASLLYLLTPPVGWLLFKPLARGRPASAGSGPVEASLARLARIPLILFALLSLVKSIGLHWMLSFVPFALMLAATRASAAGLRRLVLFFLGFAVLQVALIFAVSRMPVETWRQSDYFPSAVLTLDAPALVARAAPGETLLVSDGYSNAAILGYHLRRHVPVLGSGSGHARHDDILTDWREHDGQTLTVLRKTPLDAVEQAQYALWFKSFETDGFMHRGARFWVIRGQGFDYAAYRDSVLSDVRRRFYALPQGLPTRACYFCERYFPEQSCAR